MGLHFCYWKRREENQPNRLSFAVVRSLSEQPLEEITVAQNSACSPDGNDDAELTMVS